MAIAFDATASSSTTSTSLTFSHTCSGSDRILLVGVRLGSGDDITGVTYNSVSMTQINKANAVTDGSAYIYLYYLVAPSTGANDVVISTGVSGSIHGFSISYTGAAQSSQPNASNSGSVTSGTDMTITITTTVADCWLVGMTRDTESSVPDTGTQWDARFVGSINMGDSNASVGTAGAETFGYTRASSLQGATLLGAAIAPSTGSAVKLLTLLGVG